VKKFKYRRLKKVREIQKRLAETEVWVNYKRVVDLALTARKEVLEISKLGDVIYASPHLLEALSKWNEARKREIKSAHERWRLSLQKLLKRRTELKKVEKLEEMWRQQLFAEMLQQLAKQLDEVGSSRYKINKGRR